MQVANLFVCRSDREPVTKFGLLSNRLVLVGVAVELLAILAIDYSPPGQLLFGTGPVPAAAWLLAGSCALGLVALEEGRKWVGRVSGRTAGPGPAPARPRSGAG